MENDENLFFRPGECVTLRLEIPNKPVMLVVRKETALFKDQYLRTLLRGIRCRWFTADGLLQEATWNTKDLIRV